MNNQKLLNHLLELAGNYSNRSVVDKVNQLKTKREQYLNNIWNKEIYKNLVTVHQINKATRRIDFDTLLYFVQKEVDRIKFKQFLLAVVDLAFDSGELEYSKEVINSLIKTEFDNLTGQELASLYFKLGEIYFYQNDLETSNNHFENSMSQCMDNEDLEGVARVKNSLGVLMIEKGLYKEGKALFDSARKLASENGFSDLIIKCDISLGNYYTMQSDIPAALDKYFTVKEYAEINQNESLLIKALLNIASTYRHNREYEKSMNFIAKAEKLLDNADKKFLKALFYLVKGETLIYRDELQSSYAVLTCAFTLFSEIGDKLSIADIYRAMGILAGKKGEDDVALSFLETSIKLNLAGHNYLNLGETHLALAEFYQQRNNLIKAKEFLQSAKKCYAIIPGSQKVLQIDRIIASL
ncbi:MAG: hypothetical protein JXQ65_12605 [Candidatus Marinimicrobia bacterium]|nr:hypothetical protein [Candidatus Neomarinimicrobiota bacterium]